MIERYFSLHYKNTLNEKLQNRMENRDFGGLLRNPFKPSIYGPLLVQIIPLATKIVSDDNDKIRYNQLAIAQQLIIEKVTPKVYVDIIIYRVRLLVEEDVWQRSYTSKTFGRDLHMNERESYRYLKDNLDYFGISHEELENYLSNLVKTGPFYYPLALFNRMATLIPGFGDAGTQVLSATGRKELVL